MAVRPVSGRLREGLIRGREVGDHAVNAGERENAQDGSGGDDQPRLAALAWARLCAASRVRIPDESQNWVPVMSATSVPCPRAAASSRADRSFGALVMSTAEGEAQRKAINDWIRHGGEFDAVLDFDATFRDPNKPTRMAEGKHMGDYLHGNDAGYDAVGKSIDLKLFQ